jgi:FkbM family methyltransferase
MAPTALWRPYRGRTALLRRFLPDVRAGFSLSDGLTLEASLKKHVYIWRRARREAEIATARRIAALAPPAGVIYDLGANIGLYALVFAGNRQRTVHAFEPFPQALAYLHRNIARNHLTNIAVHAIVLSDHEGTCRFTGDDVTLCTSHISAEGEAGIDMPCSDLDAYMARQGLPVPDVIKMDIEGADMPILRGMERLLRLGRSRVFLEGGQRDDRGHIEAISYLEGLGYAVRDLTLTRSLPSDTPEYAFVAVPDHAAGR